MQSCGAATEEEVLSIAAQHAQTVYGVTATTEMAEQIKALIKDKKEPIE